MIYLFHCPLCGNTKEVYRHHTEASQEEICDKDNKVMARVWTAPQVAVSTLGYYDPGLGCYIGNKKDIANAKRRIRDENGSDIVEIGNEKPKLEPKIQCW